MIKVRKFRIVKKRNFDVWAIAIRSHLEGRNCVRNTEILYSEYNSAHYAPKTASYGKMIYMNCLRLVETVDCYIRNVSIRVRKQKLQPKTRGCIRMAGHSGNDHPGFGFLRGWPDTPGMFVRVSDFSAADFGKQPKTPSRWLQIKKRST